MMQLKYQQIDNNSTVYDSYITHDRDSLSQLEHMIYYCIDNFSIMLVSCSFLYICSIKPFCFFHCYVNDTIELLMKAM